MDDKTPPKTPDQAFIDELNQREEANRQQKNNDVQVGAINKAGIKNVEATNRTTDAVNKGTQSIKAGVKITNPDLAKSGDVGAAVDAIHKLNMTTFSTNQGLPQLADNLVNLTKSVQALQTDYESKGVSNLSKQLTSLVGQLGTVSKTLSGAKVTIDTNLQKRIDGLQKAIDGIDFKPTVNVAAPDTKVITTPVNFKSVLTALNSLEKAVNANKPKDQQVDLSAVTTGLTDVQEAIQALRFPVPNYVLPFKDSTGKATQVTLDINGNVPITGGGGSGGTQYTDGASAPTHPIGTIPVYNNAGTITAVSVANPLPVAATFSGSVTTSPTFAMTPGSTPTAAYGLIDASYRPVVVGAGTAGTSTGGVLSIQGVASGTAVPVSGTFWQTTQPVSLASTTITGTVAATQSGTWNITNVSGTISLPTGAATSANQTNNSQTTQIVNSSGNPITSTNVNGTTQSLNVFVENATAGSLLGRVNLYDSTNTNAVAVNGAGALTISNTAFIANAGTNLNTSALALETGGNLAVLAGTVTSSILQENVKQINGVVPLMGNGVTGTGSQRVTIASDNTAFSVNATLSAETTKVIGTVNQGTSPWVVGQSTASSLNATVTQGPAATLAAGWPATNGELSDVTGTFTNATQTTSVTATSLDGYATFLISINGTYNTATAVFEGSDDSGTTWYVIDEADRTDSNVIEGGYTSLTNTNRAWQISNGGWDSIRVRSTAVTSGTVNVRISPSAAPSSAGATVAIGASIPTGSNVIGHVVADSGSTTAVTQATASSLNATVVGTGAFAVQSTNQSNPGVNIGSVELTDGTNTAAINAVSTKNGLYVASNTAYGSAVPTNGFPVAFSDGTNLIIPQVSSNQVDASSGGRSIGSSLNIYNGSTYDRARGAAGVTGAQAVGGLTASGSSLASAPITAGGLAKTANPTAVSDAQVVNSLHDKLGKQVVVGSVRDLKANQVITITSSTAETTVVTAVASTFLDMYGLIVSNTSATAVNVAFKDATSGTTRFNIPVPANDVRGFMLPEGGAIKQAVVNNNWTATVSASVASVVITALTVQNL